VSVSAATRFSATDESVSRLDPILVCLRCRSPLSFRDRVFTPIAFDRSIVAEERLPAAQGGSDADRTPSFRDPVRGLVLGSNPVAAKIASASSPPSGSSQAARAC
jgi:hypothetical protein